MNHFEKIRKNLKGLDAIVLTSGANCFWASGFKTSGENDAAIVINKSGCFYFTDSRYTEDAVNKIPDAKVLDNAKIKKYLTGKVGFEDEAVTVGRFERWKKKFDCEFEGISGLMTKLRQSKDEEEIALMINAQRIAEASLKELISGKVAGATEKELAAKLQNIMMKNGADGLSFDTIVASGPNSSMPHAVPTDRVISKGDFLTIDYGCIYKGYCSDTTRTFAVGSYTDEMKEVYEAVLKAQEAGIKEAKAGVKGKDVHKAAAKVISEAGYGKYFGHAFGHSLGIEIHENPNFSPKNNKKMPMNAVVSAEPGIYIPGKFGVRIEDVVVLKEHGCEDITMLDKELISIG